MTLAHGYRSDRGRLGGFTGLLGWTGRACPTVEPSSPKGQADACPCQDHEGQSYEQRVSWRTREAQDRARQHEADDGVDGVAVERFAERGGSPTPQGQVDRSHGVGQTGHAREHEPTDDDGSPWGSETPIRARITTGTIG